MAGHGADHQLLAVEPDACELRDGGEIDELTRRGEALLHGRQKRHAAGQEFRLVRFAQAGDSRVQIAGATIGEIVHEIAYLAEFRAALPAMMASTMPWYPVQRHKFPCN